MKFNKWISLLIAPLLMVNLNSCIKDKGYKQETDFSNLQDHVTLVRGGLTSFSANNVRFSSDTSTYTIIANLASANLPKSPVTVKIGVDDALVAAYNVANGTSFELLPTNAYTLGTTTLTIPAGEQYASTSIEVYQSMIDPAKSYLLPISIQDAGGIALTGNLNTLYFNIIGNVIAGDYSWDFTRWNNSAGTGAPSGLSFTGDVATFIADNANQVEVASGYFIQPRYVISFTNNGGVLSNFKVKLNTSDVAALTTAGVTVTDGPNIIKADPINGEYIFQYTTVTRYIIDRYYR